MSNLKIPLFKNYTNKKEIKYVTKVIKRGMGWANGLEISGFEKKLAVFVGTKYCLVFNSGTSALHAILLAYDIRGKEVIVPSFTFIATANAVLHAGGKPVFADIEGEMFGLDPKDVRTRISPNMRVVIPVHYGGCACRIKELRKLAEDNKLVLIEDAAGSLGAKIEDEMVGGFGEVSMFSFAPTKVISTGEGGAVVTNSRDIFERLKLIRSHGRLETKDYFTSTDQMDYVTLGYNFRMPTICAAQGLAQLEKIDELITRRREKAAIYDKELRDLDDIRIPVEPEGFFHIYQMYSILVQDGRKTRDGLQGHLESEGIMTKVYFNPVHKTRFYNRELGYRVKLDTTDEIAAKTLTLPLYPGLKKAHTRHVAKEIRKYFTKSR